VGFLSHSLEFAAYRLLCWVLRRFSLEGVRKTARALGRFAFQVLKYRSSVTLGNLARAFPAMSESAREQLARGAYENIATTLMELLYFRELEDEDIRRIVRFPNADILLRRMEEKRGVVILTAHIGSWEMIPPALRVIAGVNCVAMYKPQSNRLIDADIVRLRTRFGTRLVSMGVGAREVFRLLSQGEAVVVAADQSAPKESIYRKFFGTDVPVFQGPAVFCLKTGAALIALYVIRQPDGTYEILCNEIRTDDLLYGEEAVKELTQRHLLETERVIRAYPDQWMWMHRRWKHAEEAGGSD